MSCFFRFFLEAADMNVEVKEEADQWLFGKYSRD